jgi:hypothetical protein
MLVLANNQGDQIRPFGERLLCQFFIISEVSQMFGILFTLFGLCISFDKNIGWPTFWAI